MNSHTNICIADHTDKDSLTVHHDQINDSYGDKIQGCSLDQHGQEMGMIPHSSNVVETPTLTIAFSPFFTFSEDRNAIDMLTSETLDELGRHGEGGYNISNEVDYPSNFKHPGQIIDYENTLYHSSVSPAKTKDQVTDSEQHSTNLTYADNLLLNAAKLRKESASVEKKMYKKCMKKRGEFKIQTGQIGSHKNDIPLT